MSDYDDVGILIKCKPAIGSHYMKELDEIWDSKTFLGKRSYNRNLVLTLQPCSYSDFQSHPEFDEAFDLWTQGDHFRGLDAARLWSLVLNVKHTLARTGGSVAELGVYKGESSAVLSHFAAKAARKMYLIDTFSGFPEHQFEDDFGEGKRAAFKDITLDDVRGKVGDYSGNRWIVGTFPESVTEEMKGDRFSFVSIDCDIYIPIIEGLKFFWPRMVPGGVIFVHDYSSGYWPGATKAVDEFCRAYGVCGVLLPDLAGSYALAKPLEANPSPAEAG